MQNMILHGIVDFRIEYGDVISNPKLLKGASLSLKNLIKNLTKTTLILNMSMKVIKFVGLTVVTSMLVIAALFANNTKHQASAAQVVSLLVMEKELWVVLMILINQRLSISLLLIMGSQLVEHSA